MSSRLVDLLLKSMLTCKWFIMSKNWLTVGGAAPIESTRSQMPKRQNTENERLG